MEGFIILDYAQEFPVAMKQLAQWVSEGKIKSKNTVIKGGLEKAEHALVDLFRGVNTGKVFQVEMLKELELTSNQENSWSKSRSRVSPETNEWVPDGNAVPRDGDLAKQQKRASLAWRTYEQHDICLRPAWTLESLSEEERGRAGRRPSHHLVGLARCGSLV